jgi:hypothetical protein
MGASSSIMPVNNNVYISFSYENEHIKMMYTELEKMDCNILRWNTKNKKTYLFEDKYTEYENDIKNSDYVIICISPDTIRSIKQIKEINTAWELKKNIIYIMTCEKYTPINQKELKSFIKDSQWFECYTKENIPNTAVNIYNILLAK